MKVGVPTEVKSDEYRVALTPAGVRELVDAGHEVYVQSGAGIGSAISDEGYAAQGAHDRPRRGRPVRRGHPDRQGEGAPAARGGQARASPRTVHLPASGRRCCADPRADGIRRNLHRVRDGRGHPRSSAAVGADVRGGRQDRHPSWRVHAREAARGSGDPPRRGSGRRRSERDDHRRRRGGHERGVHRAGDGGHGLRIRPQHRSAAGARHRFRRHGPTPASPRRWRSSSGCRTWTW